MIFASRYADPVRTLLISNSGQTSRHMTEERTNIVVTFPLWPIADLVLRSWLPSGRGRGHVGICF